MACAFVSKLPRPSPHPTSLRLNAFAPLRRFGGGGFYRGCCAYRLFGIAALHSDEKSCDFTFDPRHLHLGLRFRRPFFVVAQRHTTLRLLCVLSGLCVCEQAPTPNPSSHQPTAQCLCSSAPFRWWRFLSGLLCISALWFSRSAQRRKISRFYVRPPPPPL